MVIYKVIIKESSTNWSAGKVAAETKILFNNMSAEGKILGYSEVIENGNITIKVLYSDTAAREEHSAALNNIPNRWIPPEGQDPTNYLPEIISESIEECTTEEALELGVLFTQN